MEQLANKLLTFVSNVLTNLNLTDMETGYKAFRTVILKGMPLRSNRFGFEPEVTAKIAKLGCRIYEIPIAYYGRTYAQGKKIRSKDAVLAFFTMIKYWFVEDLYGVESAGVRTLHIMQGAGGYNTWLYRQVEPFLGNRLLEMGSGAGNITGFLLDRDYVAVSDISDDHLLELGRTYGRFPNVKVLKLDFNDREALSKVAATEDVDTILSMNVLEHVEHDDEALNGCARILKTGGRLVLMVPAHGALFSPMDRQIGHYRRYDLPSLRAKVTEAGLTVIHERHFNMPGAIGWFINGRILGRRLLPSRQVRLFDVFIGLLALEKIIHPPFGLGILLIAEKRGPSAKNRECTRRKPRVDKRDNRWSPRRAAGRNNQVGKGRRLLQVPRLIFNGYMIYARAVSPPVLTEYPPGIFPVIFLSARPTVPGFCLRTRSAIFR